ncbi:MAG: endonuclease [Pseudomonadota bacterium]
MGGVLLAALLIFFGATGWNGAVFLGLIGAAVLAWVLVANMCGALEPLQSTASVVAPSAPVPSAPTPTAPTPSAPAPAARVATPAVTVASGTTLAGEEALASKKGEWKYEGDAKAEAAPAPEPAPEPAAEDYDGDGVVEGTDEGTQPATLEGPREGGADNLKEIKGVGPKLEKLLNSMGFYHFDQIANWTDDEVAWVNANLEGFKGRVTRDDWVPQAKILAGGGDTEFSKRVDEGDVY